MSRDREMLFVLASATGRVSAIAALGALLGCNALLGLSDPIDGGGSQADGQVGPADSAIEMDGLAGEDGPPATGEAGGLDVSDLGPDAGDSTTRSDASDSTASPDASDSTASPDAYDSTTPPDTGVAADAPRGDAPAPWDDAPDGFIVGCMSPADCVDAGSCCCALANSTGCDTNGSCQENQGACYYP